MKKIFTSLFLIMLTSLLTACWSEGDEVSKALGVDVSNGTEISNYDTHGGFLGDGTTCIAYRFDDDAALEQIKSSADWHNPLDDTVRALISILNGTGNEPIIPEINNGYYLLIDRQNADGDILDRNSFNFTLGLYDTDANTLYFCKLDT